jgi:lysophospholipase L1-like esterase
VNAAGSSRAIAQKVLLALGVAVAGCVLLEVAARVRLLVKYGRSSSESYRSIQDPATGLRHPAPDQTIGAMRINSLGFRGPELPRVKPRGTLRIACIGASTTLCAEVNADAETWPERLAASLRAAHPTLAVDVINSGIPGTGVEETRIDYTARVAPLEPDVVVIYHATNDLSRDTRNLAKERGLLTERLDQPSLLARYSVVADLIEKNFRIYRRQRAATNQSAPLLDCDFTALAATFESRLARLVEECRRGGARVVVVTFSTRLRREQDPAQRIASAVTSLYYMPYLDPERLLDGFAAYNAAIRRVGAHPDALLVDAADGIPADAAHFVDSVHFTSRGCERFAEIVFAALESDPRLAARIAALVAR